MTKNSNAGLQKLPLQPTTPAGYAKDNMVSLVDYTGQAPYDRPLLPAEIAMTEIVLITGASSGIGYATAQLAAQRGHKVIACAPSAALLEDLPSSASCRCIVDLCEPATIETALHNSQQQLGPISCLINNAGFAQPGPVELVDDARLRRQFDVNVFGTMAITRALLPQLREQHGRIITLSSMLGRVSLPYQGIYAASKHALEALFEALRIELKSMEVDVDVVLIEPGWISTGFLKTSTALTPKEWLTQGPYAKQLSGYFALSEQAESAHPTGIAKFAAALAGDAEQVAQTIVLAMEADKPKARYTVTPLAKWLPRIARWLPTPLWDALQVRQTSLN